MQRNILPLSGFTVRVLCRCAFSLFRKACAQLNEKILYWKSIGISHQLIERLSLELPLKFFQSAFATIDTWNFLFLPAVNWLLEFDEICFYFCTLAEVTRTLTKLLARFSKVINDLPSPIGHFSVPDLHTYFLLRDLLKIFRCFRPHKIGLCSCTRIIAQQQRIVACWIVHISRLTCRKPCTPGTHPVPDSRSPLSANRRGIWPSKRN